MGGRGGRCGNRKGNEQTPKIINKIVKMTKNMFLKRGNIFKVLVLTLTNYKLI